MMERRGEESERLVDLDEGAARVGDAAQPQRQVHDQTHHHAIIIGAKMWESKRRKDRELDGMERAGQNKRDGQGKQAKELESRQRWRLLQMNQATSVSLSDSSLFPTSSTQASSAVTTVHAKLGSPPLPSAPPLPQRHCCSAWIDERSVAFGSCGTGGAVASILPWLAAMDGRYTWVKMAVVAAAGKASGPRPCPSNHW
jgi:hypothetical protein|uniref:Uncharacterized protein n=1 Tax=Zea mays TaxID=4577 RepID=A0A804U9F7_MAIZE